MVVNRNINSDKIKTVSLLSRYIITFKYERTLHYKLWLSVASNGVPEGFFKNLKVESL